MFFLYATAYAAATELIGRATYLPFAARGNGIVTTAVHPDGALGYVQNAGDRHDPNQPAT